MTDSILTNENDAPDPKVDERPQRRRFAPEYKLRILREADSCTKPGEVGALLRREGLYSSHLVSWRKQRDEGALNGLTPKTRGRKSKKTRESEELKRLERENTRLRKELETAQLIIDAQKILSEALGIRLESESNE